MAEIDTIYVILAVQAVGMLVTTAIYSFLRLRKEERKVKAAEAGAAANKASFEAMVSYHSRRLDLEQEKLDLARGGGKSRNTELICPHCTARLVMKIAEDGSMEVVHEHSGVKS